MNGWTPPQDRDAEVAVIGSCLMSRDSLDQCREVITADDFYHPTHEAVWSAMLEVAAMGNPVDAVSVGDRMREAGSLDRIGGRAVLHEMVNNSFAVSSGSAAYYAQIVSGLASRRRLIEYATGLASAASSAEGDVDSLISEAGARLDSLSRGHSRIQLKSLADTLTGTLDQIKSGHSPFEPSPWRDLDELIHGFRKGSLTVFAARPGGGKSLMGLQAALAVARRKVVTYAVMEMDHDEVNIRVLAQTGNINMSSLSQRKLTDFEWKKIGKVSPDLMNARLYVDDTPRQSMDHIRAHVRAASRKGELGLVVVDYLQQVKPPAHLMRAPRHEQVGNTAADLKALAMEMNVPVIAMAQARRRDTPGPPQMSDLRESGDIETYADSIVMLHREQDSLDLECHVRKARQGRMGECMLGWQSEYARLLPKEETRGWEAPQ